MKNASKVDERTSLEECVERLQGSGQYRVLRQLPKLRLEKRTVAPDERTVAIVDTETTGLDPHQDEVIEFAGIALTYDGDGRLTGAVSAHSQLREPSIPLSRDAIRLTGITPDMLTNKIINKYELDLFIGSVDLIVAHNASFDRPFCEQLSDVFRGKPWTCSATEIDWSGLGFDGAKLTYLVAHSGWFYEAHRALDDCQALACVLAAPLAGESDQTPFKQLLASARETRTRLSFPAPYSMRQTLRQRGFRWNAGDQSQPGRWYIDLPDRDAQPTVDWLTTKQGIRKSAIGLSKISAFERYR